MTQLPDKFWIVTLPTRLSVLIDICFETDLQGLKHQYAGGLQPEQVYGLYFDKDRAIERATRLLEHPEPYRE